MQVNSIQNQLTNSTTKFQAKKMPYSASVKKDLKTDFFSKEQSNDVSFKGFKGFVSGGTGTLIAGNVIQLFSNGISNFQLTSMGASILLFVTGAMIGHWIQEDNTHIPGGDDDYSY